VISLAEIKNRGIYVTKRKSKRISIKSIAEQIGCDANSISKYELGAINAMSQTHIDLYKKVIDDDI
jgi:transcriptional regulator with XRE-family HTH domain